MSAKLLDVENIKKDFRLNNIGALEKRFRSKWWKVVRTIPYKGECYCRVWWKGRNVLYHRIVWILYYGEDIPNNLQLDHRDGNKCNNDIFNLRLITNRGNSQNMRRHRDGKLVGASWISKIQKWQCGIWLNGYRIHIGLFDSECIAHCAYTIACKMLSEYRNGAQFRKLIQKYMGGKNV